MNTSKQIAELFNNFALGNNYAGVGLKEALNDITWKEAITVYKSCNSIATLVFHINYYIMAVRKVLEGGPLEAKDAESFTYTPVTSDYEWEYLKSGLFNDIEAVSILVSQMEQLQFKNAFANGNYGSNLRNLIGLLEHSHYHLGQIVLLKKLIKIS